MWFGNLCLTVKRQKTMKKIFNLILAALVIIGAASCTKNEEVAYQGGEGLSFYAEIVNGDTRAYIKKDGETTTWNTIWDEGDNVYVSLSGEAPFTFTYDGEKFTCSEPGVTSLIDKTVTIEPVANLDSKAGNKGWSFTSVEVKDFGANVKVQLEANTSFFRYTYNGDKAITFTVTADKQVFVVDGVDTDTVTISGVKGENFVAFWTDNGGNPLNATLTCSIGGVECKETTINLVPGKVYNLGTLTDPVATEYGVVGSFQGWDVADGKPVTMYEAKDGWCVARNVELYKREEFKIVKGNTWDVSYGPSEATVLEVGVEHDVVTSDSKNFKVATNGKFDIYFNLSANKVKYECVDEYTDLMVNITINNKANWSPLYIILKSGETLITPAEGALVNGNTYAVSGDYIGSSLSYQFVSGEKKSDVANVTITKDGATVTLEETIIKLRVQLTTDNAKQWWGPTMCIYVWESGSALDTPWPGTEMTSEGNYTWSINVPSELVGKTINYIINNGDKWQSRNATVTINAEGNYVNAKDIGIN